jgi:hypothetical protein
MFVELSLVVLSKSTDLLLLNAAAGLAVVMNVATLWM